MRRFYTIVLLLLVGAVGMFAVQNREPIALEFFGWGTLCPPALVAAVAYLLGMVSGWTVVGLVQRSLGPVAARQAN
jgi:lipopolysaccharide assembly protein A